MRGLVKALRDVASRIGDYDDHTTVHLAADEIEAFAKPDAASFIQRVAEVSAAVGFQSGTGAMEIAGNIVSNLAANPEHLQRFMEEGVELLLDGTFSYENGCLSFHTIGGFVGSASLLRKNKGKEQ